LRYFLKFLAIKGFVTIHFLTPEATGKALFSAMM